MKSKFLSAGNAIRYCKVLLPVLLMMAFQPTSIAQPVIDSGALFETAAVKVVKAKEGALTFQVSLDNKKGEKFTIQILDENGTILFFDKFQDKKFEKTFRIDAQLESNKLSVVIKSAKGNEMQTFEIATQTRIQQDVVVTKL